MFDLSPWLPASAREFLPAEEAPESWTRFHRFRLAMHRDLHPEDTPEPDDVAEAGMRRGDPFYEQRHLVLEGDGEIVSRLGLSAVLPGTPEYDDNHHQIEVDIQVLPERRRHGIASGWLPLAAAYADSRGARLLTAWSDNEGGQAFLSRIAEPRFRDWESRLFFDRARWDVMERWAAIDSSAWRLERYEPFPPEANWERYAPEYTELARHVPKEELEEGDWIVTPERLRASQARFAEQRTTLHVLAAWDDEGLAGVTELLRAEHDPEALDQELTAVHPRARGRGLAKLLKARLLLELRGRYPEARFVRTYNAGSNDAMWGINEAMGFERYRFGMAFQAPVERFLRSAHPPPNPPPN